MFFIVLILPRPQRPCLSSLSRPWLEASTPTLNPPVILPLIISCSSTVDYRFSAWQASRDTCPRRRWKSPVSRPGCVDGAEVWCATCTRRWPDTVPASWDSGCSRAGRSSLQDTFCLYQHTPTTVKSVHFKKFKTRSLAIAKRPCDCCIILKSGSYTKAIQGW